MLLRYTQRMVYFADAEKNMVNISVAAFAAAVI